MQALRSGSGSRGRPKTEDGRPKTEDRRRKTEGGRRKTEGTAYNVIIETMKFKFEKFIGYSIRSLAEVVTCLHKAHRRNYNTDKEFNEQYATAFNLMNMLTAFKKKIK